MVWPGPEVARPCARAKRREQGLPLPRIEDRTDIGELQSRVAPGHRVERREREARVLDRADAGGEEQPGPLRRGRGRPGRLARLLLEGHALGHDGEPRGEVGKHLGDPRRHGFVEDTDRGRAFEHAADDRGTLGIEEVVVGVGAGDGHQERDLRSPGQTKGERTDPEGVKRVDERGPQVRDLLFHRHLRHHRQVPDPEAHAPAAQAPRDTLDGDGIAANGREREGSEERNPGGGHDQGSVHGRG